VRGAHGQGFDPWQGGRGAFARCQKPQLVRPRVRVVDELAVGRERGVFHGGHGSLEGGGLGVVVVVGARGRGEGGGEAHRIGGFIAYGRGSRGEAAAVGKLQGQKHEEGRAVRALNRGDRSVYGLGDSLRRSGRVLF